MKDLKKEIEKILDNCFYHEEIGDEVIARWNNKEAIDKLTKLAKDYCEGVIGKDEKKVNPMLHYLEAAIDGRNQLRDELRTKNRRGK